MVCSVGNNLAAFKPHNRAIATYVVADSRSIGSSEP
jgi:hypothetical protein